MIGTITESQRAEYIVQVVVPHKTGTTEGDLANGVHKTQFQKNLWQNPKTKNKNSRKALEKP
jgi:hypothetical protein